MGIISDATAKTIRDVDRGIEYGSKMMGIAEKSYEKFTQEWNRAWNYDDRPAISGEAKAINPLQFMQFTPWRFVGVSRLPQTAVGAGRALYKAKIPQKVATWKTKIQNLQKPSSSNLRNTLRKTGTKLGAGAGAAMLARQLIKTGKTTGRTGKAILKDPKKTGGLAGTAMGLALTRKNQQSGFLQDEDWTPRRRVNRRTWLRTA